MNVFRMKKHHAKSLRWKMITDSFLIMSGFIFSILLLSFCGAICSVDVEEGKGRAFFQTYWALDANNSSMPCGGTLWTQYSDAPVGSEVGKLVDNDLDTKYVTYHSNVNINWNGNSSVSVKSYSLTSAADSPEADPKSWTLSGSSDNQKWVVLDTQKDQTFAERKQTKTYAVENEEEYRYYRLSIQSNHGASSTQLAELSLAASAFVGDIDDLMSKSSGSTYSPDNVMGTQHAESDLSVTQEKLLWLKDPNKEPDTFAGLSWAGFQVSNLYPFSEPCPADVNQHSIGDCCLCAVMGSLSYVYPGFIKNIIKNNGNQTFTVKLYDPKGQQIEVGVSNLFVGTSGSLGASSGKSGQPTWSTVLEKAVIKWFQAFRNTSDIGGIGSEYAAAIITGNGSSFAFAPEKLTPAELQRAVSVSLKRGKLVVGGFTKSDVPVDGKYKTVSAHAYTVSLPVDDTMLFVMRNPWGAVPTISGGHDGTGDGMLFIKDDNTVPPLIDLRIMEPGAAEEFGVGGNLSPYTPPSYTPMPMRIAPHLLRTGR